MKKKVFLMAMVMFLSTSFYYWYRNSVVKDKSLFYGENKIEIIEDGVIVLGSRTNAKTVGEFLEQENLRVENNDKIFPGKDVKIKGAVRIVIERAVAVTVDVDGEKLKGAVFVDTVDEVLAELNVVLNSSDKVEPALDSNIFKGIEIEVTRINYKEISEEEVIDYEVIQKKDKDLKWRTEKVKRKGEKGVKEVKYLVTYKDGKEVKRKKISSEITKEAVDEITVVGTKIKVGKKQRGLATWYAYTGKMAAASITFPKGTWLKVTAVNSGKQVFVVINDYGPAAYTGKILDLDKVAFEKLAPLGAGVIEVRIEEIK